MDKGEFRLLWAKIIEGDSSKQHSVRHTYKSKEMTFSNEITLYSSNESQTFSDDQTLNPSDATLKTFSGSSTIVEKTPQETFSDGATVSAQDTLGKVNCNVGLETKTSTEAHPDYRNYKEIDRGGMGIIYRVEQKKLKREIAVKKMLPGVDKKKFLAESLVTAYLEHPNIIPIHEIDENRHGEFLLGMKLVKGISWKDLLYPKTEEQKAKAQQYDLQKHLEILLNVCNAISYAHSKGIIHCDLKPENIMVGDFGEVFVMDWGIAVDINNNTNEKRTFHKRDISTPMGTPCYMPPELAEGRGKDISYTTDVYLLGGILYEILYRRPPHTGKSLWQVLLAAQKGTPDVLQKKNLNQIQKVCRKSLSKNTMDRHQSINKFKEEIENYLEYRQSVALANKATGLYNEATRQMQMSKFRLRYIFFALPYKLIYAFIGSLFHLEIIRLSKLEVSIVAGLPLPSLYSKFIQAIALYERAIELTPQYEAVHNHKIFCHVKIAELALAAREFYMAQSHIDELENLQYLGASVLRANLIKIYDRGKRMDFYLKLGKMLLILQVLFLLTLPFIAFLHFCGLI
ncbi:serine/threonine protein kinase [Candidatus Uabimicrobium amorphum]|uniref:Protein kinase n=1 Tax=Uabimicrobium amorphum TaxID=2596890 RepID=A0A5S9F543_UABAM|nr:serine/threonine-protein kinase [Candidatus Uabimicrobium amorphum]BBM86222.1 protein kinase [Candidatus Uabimicrobium amorphum]